MSEMIELAAQQEVSRPSLYHSIIEPRGLMEVAGLLVASPLLSGLPRGDGHPVLVVPGFSAGDEGTTVLCQFLKSLGYQVHAWNMGRNVGPMAGSEDRLVQRVAMLAEQYQKPVSQIGWSMGGLFVRYVGHEIPEQVRTVITLGSPIGMNSSGSNVASFLARIGRNVTFQDLTTLVDDKSWHHWRHTPPVPTSAIYTRSDGACHWRSTMDPLEHDQAENIHVPGSHIGLTHNAFVYSILANRLTQTPQLWKPYRRSGIDGLVYGMLAPFKQLV